MSSNRFVWLLVEMGPAGVTDVHGVYSSKRKADNALGRMLLSGQNLVVWCWQVNGDEVRDGTL